MKTLKVLFWDQIYFTNQEPFILTDIIKLIYYFYNFSNISSLCTMILSIFRTHFITFWFWLTWVYISSHKYNFNDLFWDPLLISWVSTCICLCVIFSSLAHALLAKSPNIRIICFVIDFVCSLDIYFCKCPLDVPLFQYKWINTHTHKHTHTNYIYNYIKYNDYNKFCFYVINISIIFVIDGYHLRAILFGINDLFTYLPFCACFKVKNVSMIQYSFKYYLLFLVHSYYFSLC